MKLFSLFLVFIVFLSVYSMQSQDTRMYRLHLKDKGNPPFSPNKPGEFLSLKSIERRNRQNLPVDSIDLPLDPVYLELIAQTGSTILTYSKWVKTVVVHLAEPEMLPLIENLPFVDSMQCVWKGTLPEKMNIRDDHVNDSDFRQNTINSYGTGFIQIALNNGHLLHEAGFRGKGISIAVLDAGFVNVEKIDFFNQLRILEIKNFNHETTGFLHEGTDHGTRVLSCMLSNKTGELIGTAPEADYYLFRTEVDKEEFPVEEDYWIAGLEYADSLGIDIVTSSLGYSTFDDSSMNHTHEQLDGKTVPVSRAAGLAASRGILLFTSAGNDGDKNWGKIGFPADAEHIITTGSIKSDSSRSQFSSFGLTADQRIKPDLMAMGSSVSVVTSSGKIIQSNGTSFSTPILAGLAACLWEALPELDSFAMLRLLRETANRFQNPDSLMGYGIADVYKAYLRQQTGVRPFFSSSDPVYIAINPVDNRLYINLINTEYYKTCTLNVYSTLGNRILIVSGLSGSIDISALPKGIYIACLKIGDNNWVRKFVKY